jgi:hypothetical protein
VALFIASQEQTSTTNSMPQPCTLGVFDLTSPVPHLRQYQCYEDDTDQDQLILLETVLSSTVPADTPHIATAVRSLMDYHAPPLARLQNRRRRGYQATDRCPLAWMTELVLAALAHGAVPAGQRGLQTQQQSMSPLMSSSSYANGPHHRAEPLLPYAGVSVSFFLADRPAGISATSKTWPRSKGGRGGGVAATPGFRFGGSSMNGNDASNNGIDSMSKWNSDNDVEARGAANDHHAAMTNLESNPRHVLPSVATETELTPHRLQERYQPVPKIEQYYADLGRQCADAAVGVDIILLITNESSSVSTDVSGGDRIPDFGLALFQPLAERSGADVPLLVDLTNDRDIAGTVGSETEPESPLARFQRSVLSRTPWQSGRVFGAELRLRASPGFAVDPTVIAPLPGVVGPQLAPLYYEAGLVGPASSVGAESAQLWRMGTAFPHTAYTMDLELTHPRVPDRCRVDSVGDVPIKPVIQTCFAYTTIVSETDPASGAVSHHTVRRMRITSCPVPLVHSVEALYASLDTEALAVVLFHKIALASIQDGLLEAAEMARQWLQLLLSCVYRSALDQLEVERRNTEQGVEADKNDFIRRYFYPGERLLHLEGDLSADDVLLAQGHDRLRPVALMVYLLLQSDPLRLGEGGQYYRPSFDERSVALSRMTAMTPSILTRCIAPRLQLWESGPDVAEPIFEVLDLRSEAVQSAVLEASSTRTKKGVLGLIIFLDTPEQIVVMDARYVNSDFTSSSGHNGSSSARMSKAQPLIVGEGLKQAINDAASSYRDRPRIVYELDQSETSGDCTLMRLLDCLLEDTPNAAMGCEHFANWKSTIASFVQKYV